MNAMQEKFYHFMLECIDDHYKDEAKALLQEGFDRQVNQTFTQEYLNEYMEKMLTYIQPEYREEVQNIMVQFSSHL